MATISKTLLKHVFHVQILVLHVHRTPFALLVVMAIFLMFQSAYPVQMEHIILILSKIALIVHLFA